MEERIWDLYTNYRRRAWRWRMAFTHMAHDSITLPTSNFNALHQLILHVIISTSTHYLQRSLHTYFTVGTVFRLITLGPRCERHLHLLHARAPSTLGPWSEGHLSLSTIDSLWKALIKGNDSRLPKALIVLPSTVYIHSTARVITGKP